MWANKLRLARYEFWHNEFLKLSRDFSGLAFVAARSDDELTDQVITADITLDVSRYLRSELQKEVCRAWDAEYYQNRLHSIQVMGGSELQQQWSSMTLFSEIQWRVWEHIFNSANLGWQMAESYTDQPALVTESYSIPIYRSAEKKWETVSWKGHFFDLSADRAFEARCDHLWTQHENLFRNLVVEFGVPRKENQFLDSDHHWSHSWIEALFELWPHMGKRHVDGIDFAVLRDPFDTTVDAIEWLVYNHEPDEDPEPPGEKASAWFDAPPNHGSKFVFGPIEGKISELVEWMKLGTRSNLMKRNGTGEWYIYKMRGQQFAAYFKTKSVYAEANARRIGASQNG